MRIKPDAIRKFIIGVALSLISIIWIISSVFLIMTDVLILEERIIFSGEVLTGIVICFSLKKYRVIQN